MEARRLADEIAARRILDEQSKAVINQQVLDEDSIVLPDVPLSIESTEEKVKNKCLNLVQAIDKDIKYKMHHATFIFTLSIFNLPKYVLCWYDAV